MRSAAISAVSTGFASLTNISPQQRIVFERTVPDFQIGIRLHFSGSCSDSTLRVRFLATRGGGRPPIQGLSMEQRENSFIQTGKK